MSIFGDLNEKQQRKLKKHRQSEIKKGTFRTNGQLNRHIAKMKKFMISSGMSIKQAHNSAMTSSNGLFTFKVETKKKRKRKTGIF